VRMKQDGITIKPINQMTGDSEFNEVFFDGARTSSQNLVGEIGEGWRVSNATLAFERGASTLGQQMQFRNELDLVIETAKQNGASKDPAIRARIAKAHAGLKVMRMNALRMLSNNGGGLSREALMTKIYWASWHRDLGELAMDVVGEDAERIEDDEMSRLQKLFLFSRADTIYAGTNQIQRNIIAERALGLPRESRGDG
ncbi:MAG: acyl-CoA dehydrogenase family protein, partial [Alphaproteobacteria bacterium]